MNTRPIGLKPYFLPLSQQDPSDRTINITRNIQSLCEVKGVRNYFKYVVKLYNGCCTDLHLEVLGLTGMFYSFLKDFKFCSFKITVYLSIPLICVCFVLFFALQLHVQGFNVFYVLIN